MVGYLRSSVTSSRWTTYKTGYWNCTIQDGITSR